jgi:dipeptidyl aminopeptidase/acylaminoacyl peptidase
MNVAEETWQDRYAAAQAMLRAADCVANGAVLPHWLDDERFWYRRRGSEGFEYRTVEASTGDVRTAFTQAALLKALSKHLGTELDAERLVIRVSSIDPTSAEATVTAFGERYLYSATDESLQRASASDDAGSLVSPDRRLAVFLRAHDLWMRVLATGEERALTNDGTEENPYAVKPAAMRQLELTGANLLPPEGRWSPDSRRFFTLQTDERHVPALPLVDFAPRDGVRPRVTATGTSMPGDPRVTEFRLISIDVETGAQTEPRYRRLTAVRMNDTPFSADLTWWSADARTAYFVDVVRGEHSVHVVAFDIESRATRTVFSEFDDAYVDLGPNVYEPALVRALPETNELIWYSERSGHGHLYLYDLQTGQLKRPITSGPWQVRHLLHLDSERRELLFTAAGIGADEDPYLGNPCLVSLDEGPVRIVSDQPGDHIVWGRGHRGLSPLHLLGEDPLTVSGTSPCGTYFVETVGTVAGLPSTLLRRRSGEEMAVVEIAEDLGLPDGWIWPEPVALTAADGVTDTHGVLFKPRGYKPSASYPVIDLIYGGPQLSFVPKSAFAHGGLGTDLQLLEAAHLASLGAFVLLLDGRGTAGRERAFHQASYGAIQTASNIEDHVAGIRELAERYQSLDLDRVGVCGFSGGGYAAALAALRFGDVFKVAVAGGGNYDQRLFWHTWGERYHGDFEAERYVAQAAKTYASAMRGKLLLIHGLLDPVCSAAGLFQLVQALIEENKDVDLVIEPREGHQLGGYGLRRRLDYFVTHLFESTAPASVRITSPLDDLARRHDGLPNTS